MKNKTLLYLGIAAVGAYYLYTKSNKKPALNEGKITLTKESIMALSNEDLNVLNVKLLADQGKSDAESKYTNSANYSYLVLQEIQRRQAAGTWTL